MQGFVDRDKRELSAALAYAALVVVVGIVTPSFLGAGNVRDLAMNNAAVLLVAIGMTTVIISGEIDISVGSQFAVCTYLTGALAKEGMPILLVLPCVVIAGVAMSAVAGALVAWLRMPSIVVTLALMVAWRDGLRWATEGAWIQDLPANFQWVGLGQTKGELILIAITAVVFIVFTWALSNIAGARSFYAVGSDAEAARLAGIDPRDRLLAPRRRQRVETGRQVPGISR